MTQRPGSEKKPGGAGYGASLEEVLDLLACPACLQALRVRPRAPGAAVEALVCQGCGRAYPLEDGIPILLVDRAVGG